MRHDPKQYRDHFQSLSEAEIAEHNRRDHEEHLRQVSAFKEAYAKNYCYLCGLPFDQMRSSHPCTHWLLRRCKFKKHDFPKIWDRYDFLNIAAFLRWCANEEVFLANINNLDDEKSPRKIISETIKWKNIEWTFDCTANDLEGHAGTHSSFPHYHFQMRIDKRPFIDFNDFHVPFSDRDLFHLSLRNEPWFHHSFGTAGDGMQEAMSVPPEQVVELSVPSSNEADAPYHVSTMIIADDRPISGEEIYEIAQEAKRTNKTIAYVAQLRLSGRANVQTIISPGEQIPDIASRSERKPR